jgi:hypothetical protein
MDMLAKYHPKYQNNILHPPPTTQLTKALPNPTHHNSLTNIHPNHTIHNSPTHNPTNNQHYKVEVTVSTPVIHVSIHKTLISNNIRNIRTNHNSTNQNWKSLLRNADSVKKRLSLLYFSYV